jgi:hypothetical protein
MAHFLKIICIARTFVVVLAMLVLGPANAALVPEPAETFFTNVAERLLRQQLGMRLTEVQIAPSNHYDSLVHRIIREL